MSIRRIMYSFVAAVLLIGKILLSVEGNNKSFDLNFHQSDYKLTPERVELVSYNKQYIKHLEVHTFKYNRTTAAMNYTAIYNEHLGNALEVVVQAYKFASNEYRLFPLRFEFNFCEAMKSEAFGLNTFGKTCGNLTGCPYEKGVTYHACNWAPDEAKFPPLIPTGKYMVEVQGLFQTLEIMVLRMYAEVTRPISWT